MGRFLCIQCISIHAYFDADLIMYSITAFGYLLMKFDKPKKSLSSHSLKDDKIVFLLSRFGNKEYMYDNIKYMYKLIHVTYNVDLFMYLIAVAV